MAANIARTRKIPYSIRYIDQAGALVAADREAAQVHAVDHGGLRIERMLESEDVDLQAGRYEPFGFATDARVLS